MAAFDDLKRMSFAAIAFPVKSVRIAGGIRDHVHEYPHSPGGAPEKLGRKLYEISVQAMFLQNLVDPAWANLWPVGLAKLRRLWEDQVTADLHIPTIGTIKAYAVDWTQDMDARIRSGEMVDLKFREDQSSAFLIEQLIKVSPSSLVDKLALFTTEAETMDPYPSIFDGIEDTANAILSFGDQFELAGNLIEAKILGLVHLLRAADAQVRSLNDPVNHRILDALHELWLAAVTLHEDVQKRGAQIRSYTTPFRTTVADVTRAIFGDGSKASEILQLNAIEDPFDIPAGQVLRYYEAA